MKVIQRWLAAMIAGLVLITLVLASRSVSLSDSLGSDTFVQLLVIGACAFTLGYFLGGRKP